MDAWCTLLAWEGLRGQVTGGADGAGNSSSGVDNICIRSVVSSVLVPSPAPTEPEPEPEPELAGSGAAAVDRQAGKAQTWTRSGPCHRHGPCRNGVGCTRPDCYFGHPPGRSIGGTATTVPAPSKLLLWSGTNTLPSCDLCGLSFNGPQQLTQHLGGKAHKKRARQRQQPSS
jgi:hypothetical protein